MKRSILLSLNVACLAILSFPLCEVQALDLQIGYDKPSLVGIGAVASICTAGLLYCFLSDKKSGRETQGKIMLSHTLLTNALATLSDSFIAEEEAVNLGNIKLILAAQDSTIQRFKYCYDSFWKFLKIYFEP